jgi:hypothetical protein
VIDDGRKRLLAPIDPRLDRAWIGCKTPVGDIPGEVYLLNWDLSRYELIEQCPFSNWVESLSRMTFASDGYFINWSDYGDSSTWKASNAMGAPQEIGTIEAVVAIPDGQALVFGRLGIGLLRGDTENSVTITHMFNTQIVTPARSVVRCGDRVCFLAPGPRIIQFLSSTLQRIDGPINKDLEEIEDLNDIVCWYDPVRNCYCMSDKKRDRTWLFDLEKNRWIGTWDVYLVGMATIPAPVSPFQGQVFGFSQELFVMKNRDTFFDGSKPFDCTIETEPNDLGVPETEKQMLALFVDGTGRWDLSLKFRNTPGVGDWQEIACGTVDAPGWLHLPADNVYRERTIRLVGRASGDLTFRKIVYDERIVGLV